MLDSCVRPYYTGGMTTDRRRHFIVTVTTITGGRTEHDVYGTDPTSVRRAAHQFAVAWGHPLNERRRVTVRLRDGE